MPGLAPRAFWSDKLMGWAMKDEAFKVQLFRLIGTFLMLRTPEQMHDHRLDYLTHGSASGTSLGALEGDELVGRREDRRHRDDRKPILHLQDRGILRRRGWCMTNKFFDDDPGKLYFGQEQVGLSVELQWTLRVIAVFHTCATFVS